MWQKRLNNKERMARLIGGSIITGIALSGGFKSTTGKAFVTLLGAAALFEGVVNQHLTDYFDMDKVL